MNCAGTHLRIGSASNLDTISYTNPNSNLNLQLSFIIPSMSPKTSAELYSALHSRPTCDIFLLQDPNVEGLVSVERVASLYRELCGAPIVQVIGMRAAIRVSNRVRSCFTIMYSIRIGATWS